MMSVMRMRTAAMVGGWALAVSGATAAGWAGVGLIGDEVSPSGPAALSQAEVHRRVQAAATTRAPAVTVTPTTAATAPAAVTPGETGQGSSGSSDPGRSTGSSAGGPATGRTSAATRPPATTESSQRRSYTLRGGVVVLACTGTLITANTSPSVGFTAKRESVDQGTGVKVEFQSGDAESTLVGRCTGGAPSATVEEHRSEGD